MAVGANAGIVERPVCATGHVDDVAIAEIGLQIGRRHDLQVSFDAWHALEIFQRLLAFVQIEMKDGRRYRMKERSAIVLQKMKMI